MFWEEFVNNLEKIISDESSVFSKISFFFFYKVTFGWKIFSCLCKSDVYHNVRSSLTLQLRKEANFLCETFAVLLFSSHWVSQISSDQPVVMWYSWTWVMAQIETLWGYFCASTLGSVINQTESIQVSWWATFCHTAKFTFVGCVNTDRPNRLGAICARSRCKGNQTAPQSLRYKHHWHHWNDCHHSD